MTLEDLADILRRKRYNVTCERELQEAIQKVLEENGVPFERECRLGPKDRPDFMVLGIAIEIKVDGRPASITTQLQRYALHPTVTSILFVTTRAKHCCMPSTLVGKSVKTLYVRHL